MNNRQSVVYIILSACYSAIFCFPINKICIDEKSDTAIIGIK